MPPEAEMDLVATTLDGIAADHESRYVLEAAGVRGRWEDVPDAIRWAIAEEGVEMGLVRTHTMVDGYIFQLITVEGWPASLTVRRADDSRVYIATAEVGRFHDVLDRSDRAAALVEAFDEWMAALGAKLQLVPRDD